MNLKKLLSTAITLLCMSMLLCTGALAVDLEDPRFAGKTWDQVFEEFLAANEVAGEKVTAAYYNTVTGEEHIFNEGTLMYGASVAKLPTNMVFAERISKGEMTFETVIRGSRYDNLQKLSLVNSDNPAQEALVRELGGGSYAEFRKAILPYIGLTEADVDDAFLARNFFAPEQILSCLKLLYGNEERFPGVEACMKQAHQFDYFCGNQPPYTIAHKYGWYTDRGTEYVNDSAIVYTDDPILLVMFTASVGVKARPLLADYCSLMIDYTQYHRAVRYQTEATEQAKLTIPTQLAFISADTPSHTPGGYATWQFGFLAAGCVSLIIALILLVKKSWITTFFLMLCIVLIVIGGGPTELAYMAVRDGSAVETVESFAGEFHTNRGVKYLNQLDYAMPNADSADLEAVILNKVSQSFTMTVGKAERTGNYIMVPVTYTKADLKAIAADLPPAWEASLYNTLTTGSLKELYDETGAYQSAAADNAVADALEAVLEKWDSYLVTENTVLHLTLGLDGLKPTWKIIVNDLFLDMVNYN